MVERPLIPSLLAPFTGEEPPGAADEMTHSSHFCPGRVSRRHVVTELEARRLAHANDPVLGDYRFNVEYRTDVYAEQRGLEQTLYDQYPAAQSESGGFNKIRGISPSNADLPFYMQSAQDFLDALGGG
ncbi:MAG: hypothetical protein ACRDZ8_01970 [Acidimicrobiales bacterium]